MQPDQSLKRAYLPGLTGLRGIGALWVLCYHAQFELDIPVAEYGFLGVDLFFILSGFVLSHAHGAMRISWPAYRVFLQDRIARIFPLHWAALALLAAMLVIYPKIYNDMSARFQLPDLVASLLLVQNWGFTRPMPWNVPSWSLSTEWLVSLGFPLFLLVARRFTRPAPAVAGIVACLLLFELFLLATHNVSVDVQSRGGIVRTILEFAIGCLLYRLFLTELRVPSWAAWGGFALLALGMTRPSLTILAVVAFPIIVLLSAQPARLTSFLASPVMAFLGKISFSIYLLHWTLLQVSDRVRAALGVHGALSLLWFCGFVLFVLALSTASYHLIENPARRWLRGAGLRRVPGSGGLLQLDR